MLPIEMNIVLFQGSRLKVKRWLDQGGARGCYTRVDVKAGRTTTGVSYAVVTCPTHETAMYAFSVAYKWYAKVTQDIDARGWRYVSLKWWGEDKDCSHRREAGDPVQPGQPMQPCPSTSANLGSTGASSSDMQLVPLPPPGQPRQPSEPGQYSSTGLWLPWALPIRP